MGIIELCEAGDAAQSGGKGAALARLLSAGFNVPDGFVITSSKTINAQLSEEILAAFDKLGAKNVAVRSSAMVEDGAQDAWAGQMDTFLNVKRGGLIEAVQQCRRSAHSERAKAYAKQKNLATGRIAVVVQEMISGDVSGVAFSVHPVSQNASHMVVEAIRGLADSLVSGEQTPDNYVIDKFTGGVLKQTTQGNQPLLNGSQLKELAKTVIKLEKLFGFSVDVEWTFANDELFILQSRPITTLG